MRGMNHDNTTPYSLAALHAAVTIYINTEKDVLDDPNPHLINSHLDPLALKHHRLS